MKYILCVVACLLAAGQVQGATVLIDFDNSPGGPLAGGTVLTNQYASLGVNFSAIENGGPTNTWVSEEFASNTPNPPNNSGNSWNNYFGTPRADIMRILFDNPASNVQWYTDTEGTAPAPRIQFDAYNSGGILLESVTVVDSIFPAFVLTQFAVEGISRIDAIQPNDSWGWGLDNLSFSIVPEPSTFALAGVCLLGICCRRRKSI